eukprot:COSAG06_NODE_1577_length_9052_cov_3.355747_3_plen_198_part_00
MRFLAHPLEEATRRRLRAGGCNAVDSTDESALCMSMLLPPAWSPLRIDRTSPPLVRRGERDTVEPPPSPLPDTPPSNEYQSASSSVHENLSASTSSMVIRSVAVCLLRGTVAASLQPGHPRVVPGVQTCALHRRSARETVNNRRRPSLARAEQEARSGKAATTLPKIDKTLPTYSGAQGAFFRPLATHMLKPLRARP